MAKLLGLAYPGGPEIDRLAGSGDTRRFDFPRGMLHDGSFDFSFSGLKTAVRYLVAKLGDPAALSADPLLLADLCASFQEAVVEVLVGKTLAAAQASGQRSIAVSGGVSLNSRLRHRFAVACAQAGLELWLASPALCTDNAAMIAHVAQHAFAAGLATPLTEDIDPNLALIAALA